MWGELTGNGDTSVKTIIDIIILLAVFAAQLILAVTFTIYFILPFLPAKVGWIGAFCPFVLTGVGFWMYLKGRGRIRYGEEHEERDANNPKYIVGTIILIVFILIILSLAK